MLCDRCGKPTVASTVSFFDTSTICPKCEAIEKAHPAWEAAHRKEEEMVLAGNYNFEGVGLPNDLQIKFEGVKHSGTGTI